MISNGSARRKLLIPRTQPNGKQSLPQLWLVKPTLVIVAAGQQSKIQVNFSYSDGLGREIQRKIQAEAGPLDLVGRRAPIVDPRWLGSGWTILNNKGKPVRQYEPFFSATHDFEFANKVGVTSTLFYDPL